MSNVTDVPPREISRYMNELVNFINNRGYGKLGLVEQAACVHYRFSQIQPCPNSGVTARLLMNFVLIRSRYPLTVVRWNDRREYFDSLDKRDSIYVLQFVTKCVMFTLNAYLIRTRECLMPIGYDINRPET